MNIREHCARYQDAVSRKDWDAVEALFVRDAVIRTPLRGDVDVKDFHAFLFQHIKQGAARFPNVFEEKTNPSRISLQFSYTFLTNSTLLGGLDGVAVFEYDDNRQQFTGLRVEYDATVIRKLLAMENIDLPSRTGDSSGSNEGDSTKPVGY
jgi:hypothetical protein